MMEKLPGKIITFYSYKGGTGRSMALANTAWILASNGKRVLIIDWDLEAPGVHRYFSPFLLDPDLTSSEGLIDFLDDYATEAIKPHGTDETISLDWYLSQADITDYAVSLDWPFPEKGTLDLIPAGRQGQSYASRVNSFNWRNFYERLGGGTFLEAAKEKMRKAYDYILIDSRTGVSDTAGICTVQMPDVLVVCFTLNNQSIEGAAAVASSVYEQRKKDDLPIFPIPMRVELAEKDKLDRRMQYAKRQFSLFPNKLRLDTWKQYWEKVPILYIPYYAYEEILAAFGDKNRQVGSLLASTEQLVSYLTDGEIKVAPPMSETDRQRILARYEGRAVEADPLSELNQQTEIGFARLSPEEQQIARRVLNRLVRVARPNEVSGDVLQRLDLKEFSESTHSVVQKLADARILSVERVKEADGATVVQLAAPELLQGWARWRTWIQEDREFLLWRQEELGNAIANWKRTGRDSAALLRGNQLDEAERYIGDRQDDFSSEEQIYIEKSRSQQQQTMPISGGIHAFVLMPFGVKEGIDFNRVYSEFIVPALQAAGFSVYRTDEELRAGNFRTDMFQELVLADLIIVDLSIDTPNVWYQLGIRHALRSRGVIQIQCKRDYMPFDIYVDRTLRYHIKDGAPDPTTLEDDKRALATFATQTMESWHGRKISPVYHLLRYLKEPDWKSLRVEEAKEFWEAYEKWVRDIEVARRKNLPGDILVFTKEAPSRMLLPEARCKAGKALLSLGQFSYALHQYQEALNIDPDHLESRRQKGLVLGRLKRYDKAKEWLKAVLKDHPNDAESWAMLGRIEKEAWIMNWQNPGKTVDEMREDALAEEGFLHEATDAYITGFSKDPRHYYAGSNAVTLLTLGQTLVNGEKTAEQFALEGGVRWVVLRALRDNPKDYWARLTLGDLDLVSADKAQIERQYRAAVAVAERDWFALDSSRQQLLLLRDLGFRPAEVEAALRIFDRELEKLTGPQAQRKPRKVFLFSGHMIDVPGRSTPRFPADKELIATRAITAKLEELGAGAEDLALCGGACGGDLIFAEACLNRDVRLEVRIPFEEAEFLEASVNFAGDTWRERFYRVKEHKNTELFVMPDKLGPLPAGKNPFARNNLWQLYTALSWGPDKVCFICLWNRKGGDGPGGTQHLYESVLTQAGQVHVLDTTTLW